MSTKAAMVGIFTVTALAFATESALAMPRSQINAYRTACFNAGGDWIAPNSRGVFGCFDMNGHGFACGGDTASTRNSCDYF